MLIALDWWLISFFNAEQGEQPRRRIPIKFTTKAQTDE
jgi:hypothetical protein